MDPRIDLKKLVTMLYLIVTCFRALKMRFGSDRNGKRDATVAPGRVQMIPRCDKQQVAIGYLTVTCFWAVRLSCGRD